MFFVLPAAFRFAPPRGFWIDFSLGLGLYLNLGLGLGLVLGFGLGLGLGLGLCLDLDLGLGFCCHCGVVRRLFFSKSSRLRRYFDGMSFFNIRLFHYLNRLS